MLKNKIKGFGILFLIVISAVLAANDPGHDSLYVESIGDIMTGILNASASIRVGNRTPVFVDLGVDEKADLFISDSLEVYNWSIFRGNVNASEVNITAAYFIGDGSQLTNVNESLSAQYVDVGGDVMTGTLNISTGNFSVDNVLFVDSTTGRVGIGTLSPVRLLEVSGEATGFDPRISITNKNISYVADTIQSGLEFRLTAADSSSGTAALIMAGKESNWTNSSHRDGYLDFYTNAADSIGSPDMRIDSSGRVGIGTTSPISKLHVVGNLTTNGTIAVGTFPRNWTQFGNGTKSESSVSDLNDVYVTGDLEVDGVIHGTIGAENVDDVWVNESGDVMSGAFNISSGNLSVGGGLFADALTGYVGIGTISPGAELHIVDATASAGIILDSYTKTQYSALAFKENGTNAAWVQFINSNYTTANRRNNLELYNDISNGSIAFHTDSATPDMIVHYLGYVGIGTLTPTHKLHVIGNGTFVGLLNMSGYRVINLGTPTAGTDATTKTYVDDMIGGGGYTLSGWNDTGTVVELITGTDDVNATAMYINNTAGYVGIGTGRPGAMLDVAGEAKFDGALYARDATGIGLKDDAGNLGLWVEDGGQVGIGTDSPGAKLHSLATTEQFRLGYDPINYASFTVADDGLLTIATVDPDGAEADIILAPDGYVGIGGVTAPSQSLEVWGTSKVVGQGWFTRSHSVGAPLYSLQTGTGPSAYFMGGNVGIGRTDPQTLLHVHGDNPILRVQDSDSTIRNSNLQLSTAGGYWTFAAGYSTGVNNDLHIGHMEVPTAGDTIMTITRTDRVGIKTTNPTNDFDVGSGDFVVNTTSGNVGIGTTSPSELLEIQSPTGAGFSKIKISNINANIARDTVIGELLFEGNDASSGYDPISTASIKNIAARGLTDSHHWGASGDGTTEGGELAFFTLNDPTGGSLAEAMRINQYGNVGINTTTPSAALDIGNGTADNIDGINDLLVADDIEVDGDIWVGGTIHGTIGAENVEDVWVNETGDKMTGSLNMTSANVTGDNFGIIQTDDAVIFGAEGGKKLILTTNSSQWL